jgi:predicted transglutaminase-like cysteine proteinase
MKWCVPGDFEDYALLKPKLLMVAVPRQTLLMTVRDEMARGMRSSL